MSNIRDLTVFQKTDDVFFYKITCKTGLIVGMIIYETVLTIFTLVTFFLPGTYDIYLQLAVRITALSLQVSFTIHFIAGAQVTTIFVKIDKVSGIVARLMKKKPFKPWYVDIARLSTIRSVVIQKLTYPTETRGRGVYTSVSLDMTSGIMDILPEANFKRMEGFQMFIASFLWGSFQEPRGPTGSALERVTARIQSRIDNPGFQEPQKEIDCHFEELKATIRRINPGGHVMGHAPTAYNSRFKKEITLVLSDPIHDRIALQNIERDLGLEDTDRMRERLIVLSRAIERTFVASNIHSLPEKVERIYILVLFCLARAAKLQRSRDIKH
ncbi:MAG: hypothetical protein Q6353_004395 [Candidatus Sigynarchaeum springense]